MADFELALAPVLVTEGGWVHNPADPGGETFRGVSRRYWPNWPGWPKVDAAKRLPNFPATVNTDAELLTAAKSFYRENFWHFDGLTSQVLADKLLDIAVNLGMAAAVKILQLSIRHLNNHSALAVDGKYGPATEAEANGITESRLLAELRARQALHYAEFSKKEFWPDLMRRAAK